MAPQELVIISGKGGTGKTSIAASFAALAEPVVVADCDVDAADLHLVLQPRIEQRDVFRSGHEARIRMERCTGCGECARLCRFDAIVYENGRDTPATYAIDPFACEGCGVCVRFCPQGAIDFEERTCGEWFVSETRYGPMVHAKLGIAAENSGKLVSLVRREARELAQTQGLPLIIIDGSPGIGCPVIASLTGATLALVVAEPTVSGLHDLERVVGVARHFSVPTWVCVNKWDINEAMTRRIERFARAQGVRWGGRVRLDPAVTAAQRAAQPVVQHASNGAAADIRAVWETVTGTLCVQRGVRDVTRDSQPAAPDESRQE
jgi:MinD superfamily P-loop ATPase